MNSISHIFQGKELIELRDKYKNLKQKYFQMCQLHADSTMKLQAVRKIIPDDENIVC